MRVDELLSALLIWVSCALEAVAVYEIYFNGESTKAFFLLFLVVCNYLSILALFTLRVGSR